jgi:hypothetical protein
METTLKEFPNYKITIDGEVFSNHSGVWKLKSKVDNKGYDSVQLVRPDGSKQRKSIHRLVAENFIPNLSNKPCVNHIDGNKKNNCSSNLEWCSYSENEKHSYQVLNKAANKTNLGNTGYLAEDGREIHQYYITGEYLKSYGSCRDAASKINGSQGTLHMAAIGKRKSHKGYRWSFEKMDNLPSMTKGTTKKLSTEQVLEIRALLSVQNLGELAEQFAVSKDTIRDIKHCRGAYNV